MPPVRMYSIVPLSAGVPALLRMHGAAATFRGVHRSPFFRSEVRSACPSLSNRECGSTIYVGMAQGVSFSLYIGIGAKFENTQKTGERRLRTAEYRTVLL